MKVLVLLAIIIVLTDSRRRWRKKKKKPTPAPYPKCSAPKTTDCMCWFDLTRNDCACCVEDFCIQTNDVKKCVHKKAYLKESRKPYILDTPNRKMEWCYGHDFWCGSGLYPYCSYPGKGCPRRSKKIYYRDLIKSGMIECSKDARFYKPPGERSERCVCKPGFVGNGLQCMEEGEDEFVEVVEEVDPTQIVKISFEIESNSTVKAISEMEALTQSCIASTCEMDKS